MRRPSSCLIRPNSTVYQYRRVRLHQRLGAEAVRLDAAAAVGLHVVGEDRVEQQRHVAEQVVEQVRLGDVVDLLGFADPPGHRKAPVGQMIEERQLRQQAFDADQRPSRLPSSARD